MPLFMMTAWGCTSKQSSVYTLLRLILKTEWRNCLIECFWEKRFCNWTNMLCEWIPWKMIWPKWLKTFLRRLVSLSVSVSILPRLDLKIYKKIHQSRTFSKSSSSFWKSPWCFDENSLTNSLVRLGALKSLPWRIILFVKRNFFCCFSLHLYIPGSQFRVFQCLSVLFVHVEKM